MTDNLISVKMGDGYHHGDLRAALLQATEELLAEHGVDRFSLRAAARRVGVSPAAHSHHFKDVKALFTALVVSGFTELADRLEAVAEPHLPDRVAAIRAQGVAYVRFAIERPSRFDLMWRPQLLDQDDKEYIDSARRAFLALDRLVRGEGAPALAGDDPALASTIACWSLVHGFATLAISGSIPSSASDAESLLDNFLPAVLAHLEL